MSDTDRKPYPIDVANLTMTVETVTLVDSVGQGASKPCRLAMVKSEAACALGESATAAAAGIPLSTTEFTTLPVANTDMLYFNGTTGEKVYVLSFI